MEIHLGYEVGTGAPVAIPLGHSVFVGQSQRSGKTTTMQALLTRADPLRSLAFATKRGEIDFPEANPVPPFFLERVDWEYVRNLLESMFSEKMKFETVFIHRAAEGAKTLADVRRKLDTLLQETKSAYAKDIYLRLSLYLDKILPSIADLPKSRTLKLSRGLNVMDLIALPDELQMLVIESCLRFVHEKMENVVCVIPEAWKMIPEGRNTPVKRTFEQLVRQGGGLGNFVFADTQDTAGMAKLMLRQARVWLIGVQREPNEIKRNLDAIPLANSAKPKALDVMNLHKGEFFACYDGEVWRTYVQPVWMDAETAQGVARGNLVSIPLKEVALVERPAPEISFPGGTRKELDEWVDTELDRASAEYIEAYQEQSALVTAEKEEEEKMDITKMSDAELSQLIDKLQVELDRRLQGTERADAPTQLSPNGQASYYDVDTLYGIIRDRILKEPKVLKVLATKAVLEISYTPEVISASGDSLRGRVARLIKSGFLNDPVTGYAVYIELADRQGFSVFKGNVYKELEELTRMGFLRRNEDKKYVKLEGAEIHITK